MCRARDDKDVAAWSQTLRRDYKACIVEENLCASSKWRRGVNDYSLLDCAGCRGGEWGTGGCCRGERELGFIASKLR